MSKKKSKKEENIAEEPAIKKEEKIELSKEEKLEQELAKEKDKFLRLFAEFENYKRRTAKERIELFRTAGEDIMITLLPVLDDFERALLHIDEDKEAEELRKGVLLIYQKLLSSLTQKGLTKIEVKQAEVFDVELHEAITQIPAPTDDLKGKIIDVIEQGYKLGDKIIRYPKVVVGQ